MAPIHARKKGRHPVQVSHKVTAVRPIDRGERLSLNWKFKGKDWSRGRMRRLPDAGYLLEAQARGTRRANQFFAQGEIREALGTGGARLNISRKAPREIRKTASTKCSPSLYLRRQRVPVNEEVLRIATHSEAEMKHGALWLVDKYGVKTFNTTLEKSDKKSPYRGRRIAVLNVYGEKDNLIGQVELGPVESAEKYRAQTDAKGGELQDALHHAKLVQHKTVERFIEEGQSKYKLINELRYVDENWNTIAKFSFDFNPESKVFYPCKIQVDEKYRRQGVADSLYPRLLEIGKKLGARIVKTTVDTIDPMLLEASQRKEAKEYFPIDIKVLAPDGGEIKKVDLGTLIKDHKKYGTALVADALLAIEESNLTKKIDSDIDFGDIFEKRQIPMDAFSPLKGAAAFDKSSSSEYESPLASARNAALDLIREEHGRGPLSQRELNGATKRFLVSFLNNDAIKLRPIGKENLPSKMLHIKQGFKLYKQPSYLFDVKSGRLVKYTGRFKPKPEAGNIKLRSKVLIGIKTLKQG